MAKNTNQAAGANATKAAEAPKTGPVTVTTATSVNKADKARAIFSEMFAMNPRPARKDMIARAVKEADLTPAGAATYLQNYKTKNNLVVKKTTPAA